MNYRPISMALITLLASVSLQADSASNMAPRRNEVEVKPQIVKDSASYTEIEDRNQLEIKTPALQKRQTEKIQLANGLDAYLISDPGADKSGAALSVEVGCWEDPKEYPGMAHFLEHMLFMGNKAYPEESEFFKYIYDHGGNVNAYTSTDRTVYMFSINNEDFALGLDRFSHFFIDPLFLSSGIGRELHAVDQENDKNIENDGWRQWMILKETGNPSHPNAMFSTGSAETLGHIPREALVAWYEKYYNAAQMNLVVVSTLPLDQLKALIIQDFSAVTNSPLPPALPVAQLTSPKQEGHKIFIKPIKDLRQLEITWELPVDLGYDLDTKTALLLSEILSKQGEGSLFSLLKSEDLAESLKVGVEQISKENYLFIINVGLTKFGVVHANRAIELTFEMLASLKEKPLAPYHFDELKTTRTLAYEYQSRPDIFDFVMSSAHALVDESLATFPQKSEVASYFDENKFKELLDVLTPKKAIYFIIAPPALSGVEPNKKERWLGGEYAVQKVPSSLLDQWTKTKANPELFAPHPNPFIPTHLTLINTPLGQKPQLIADDAYGRVYFAPDPRYQVPNSTYIISFHTPLIDGSARATALTDLFIKSLRDRLSPLLSFATDANLNAGFGQNAFKFQILVDGFSEKAPELLRQIVANCKEISVTRDQFELYQDQVHSQYENREKVLPFFQANEMMANILYNDAPKARALSEAIKQISYADFLSFCDKFLKEAYVEALFAGNLTQTDAKALWQTIGSTLAYSPYAKEDQYKKEVLLLPDSSGPFMVFERTKMQGNAALLTIQEGPFSFDKLASQQILEAALKQAFFAELRTKQQTAYIAKSWARNVEDQLLHFFGVQSSTHDPLDLISRFELFLEDMTKDFETALAESRFDEMKSSLLEQLRTPPPNLSDYASLMYHLAFIEKGDFDYIEKEMAALEGLTYAQLKADAIAFFSRKNTRRLALLVEGATTEGKGFRYIDVTPNELQKIGSYVSAN